MSHSFLFYHQTTTEKHKMNVPETMNEFLDMSEDEGMSICDDVTVSKLPL